MKATEQLAILTALKKQVEERLKEVRAEVDDDMREGFEDDGIEKKSLNINGNKVGEILVTYASDGYDVCDTKALEEMALDYGFGHIERTIRPDMMDSCIKALEEVFEPDVLKEAITEKVVVDKDWDKYMTRVGNDVTFMDTNVLAPVKYRPKRAKGTMVKGCNPSEVLPIIQSLGSINAVLLGDGNE